MCIDKGGRSGAYVCNDQDVDIELEMFEVTDQMSYMMGVCIGGNSIGKDNVSGRVRVDTSGGWNLNLGYCNGTPASVYLEHKPS